MLEEINQAIAWALQQTITSDTGHVINVTSNTKHLLVDKVREYFNNNNIQYDTFSYDDLAPYLVQLSE